MDQKRHTFPDKVRATITKYSMLLGGETVLVGLSGGPDSVCLLSVLHKLRDELNLKLHAVYVDHGLRPAETPEEIVLSRKLCEGMSVSFAVRTIDVKTYAKDQGMNKQEAARELRFRVFDEVLGDRKAGRIALGHNADDQLETFLMRFFRGAGPKGLSGIPPVRARIIRPLIEVKRSEIEKFLEEQRTNFVIDSSNVKEDYLRNRLRLIVVPEIRKINPDIAETAGRTMDILREEEKHFDLIVTKTLMKLICKKTDHRIELFLTPLEAMDKVVLRRVLRRAIDETKGLRGVGFAHIEEIIELIRSGRHGGRLILPRGLRVIKEYATFVMTSEMPHRLHASSFDVPGELVLNDIKAVIKASLEEKEDGYGDGKTLAVFDADKAGSSLVVRPKENGDFFYPMGFGKRKKLQDFFVDEKIPRDERGMVPIVVSGRTIIWIAGYRGDERFKVTEGTKRFLRLEFKKKI